VIDNGMFLLCRAAWKTQTDPMKANYSRVQPGGIEWVNTNAISCFMEIDFSVCPSTHPGNSCLCLKNKKNKPIHTLPLFPVGEDNIYEKTRSSFNPGFYVMKGFAMEDNKAKPCTVDEYIARFPQDVQQILGRIRAVILESAPGAEEKISYQMPGYYLNGGLVWFGAYKKHIGFYPLVSSEDEDFNRELAAYRGTKGSLHFPLDKPMPYDLIRKIVSQRLAENRKKAPQDWQD
jgi:uncharacterized protein YdhG (YjbR/CyaY superfamily)